MRVKFNKSLLFSVAIFIIAALSFITDSYGNIIFFLTAVLVLMILDNLGKAIVLREVTALMYVLTCLIMPWVGYRYYTFNNPLSRIWVKYMPVQESIYFGFALPAIAFFCLAITLPLSSRAEMDKGDLLVKHIGGIKDILKKPNSIGIWIMATGIVISFLIPSLPGEVQFFATLIFFSSFAGLLYVYYSPVFRYKRLIIVMFVIFILVGAINSGMFTIVAYMGITIFSFIYLGKRHSLFRKILILCASVFFFLVLQNTKKTLREKTWNARFEGNKISLFAELFWTNLQKGDLLIENTTFFPVYTRTNQGFNVALVMRRIPAQRPFDEGANLFINFASTLVPRFLWPDKPKAGGKFNMQYYAGWKISGWSTNVGPLGEAYGSFGQAGIFYMFLLGLFIRFIYKLVFKYSQRNPVLLFWIPVLFFQTTYSAEADSLQIINSLLKTAFFIWLLYKLLPVVFPGFKNGSTTNIQKEKSPVLQY